MSDNIVMIRSTTTDEEDEQFIFDDENTIQRTDIPGIHAPIVDKPSFFF